MINPKHQRSLEAIVVELDESNLSEKATRSVLLTVLAANETNEEQALLDHVSFFARRLLRDLACPQATEQSPNGAHENSPGQRPG